MRDISTGESGFAFPLVIIFIAVVLGIGGTTYYATRTTENTPSSDTDMGQFPAAETKEEESLTTKAEIEKAQPAPTYIKPKHVVETVAESSAPPAVNMSFERLKQELLDAEASGSLLAPEHYNRIIRDLDILEGSGHSALETAPLRTLAANLAPHITDQRKAQNPPTQVVTNPPSAVTSPQPTTPNCKNNPLPTFTHHITDMSQVNYIVPPPTMGAGPSLKPHSYIGTDHARVPVYAPIDMTLITGAHTVEGPYGFIFRVSCEVQLRFGHITEPIQEIKDVFPLTPAQDSRDQKIEHEIFFKAGDIIAYTIGTKTAGNWDFGVYNSATSNRYANDPEWGNSSTYTTAVCPFDYFETSLRQAYIPKFNSTILGGNPPHGEPFCKQ